MRKLLYKWFTEFFSEELQEEGKIFENGGYLSALYDTAKELLSRGMDVAEVADIVGIDVDNLEENFGELIAWQKTVL